MLYGFIFNARQNLDYCVASPILTSKLFIPPLRADLLSRSHLIEKLNDSTAYPVTLISASAGSGKTTMLSEWVAKTDRPVAWISLDPDDNDPAQFIPCFIFALRTIRGDIGEEAFESLQSSPSEPFESTMINLINNVIEFPEDFTLIFDDYHTITDQRTNDLIIFWSIICHPNCIL
jgi:LuxR family maltose regulon positive regulatory protein